MFDSIFFSLENSLSLSLSLSSTTTITTRFREEVVVGTGIKGAKGAIVSNVNLWRIYLSLCQRLRGEKNRCLCPRDRAEPTVSGH